LASGPDGSVITVRSPFGATGTVERFSANGGLIRITGQETHDVSIYNLDGQRLRHWGEPGEDPGELWQPTSIAVRNGHVVVYDAKAVAVFDEDGTFRRNLRTWAENDYWRARKIALDDQGLVYACAFGGRVYVYNLEGFLQAQIEHEYDYFWDVAPGPGALYVVSNPPSLGGKVLKFKID